MEIMDEETLKRLKKGNEELKRRGIKYMEISSLQRILRCPVCNYGNLDKQDEILICDNCNHTFEIKDGVPILTPRPLERYYYIDPYYQESWKKCKKYAWKGLENCLYTTPMLGPVDIADKAEKGDMPHWEYYKRIYHDEIRLKNLISFFRKTCDPSKEYLVLDLGSGLGNDTYKLCLEFSNLTIIGIDLVLWSVIASQQYHANEYPERLQYICGDATVLPFQDDSFDIIFSINAYEHAGVALFREAYRILKQGGVGMIIGPSAHAYIFCDWLGYLKSRLIPFQLFTPHGILNSEVREMLESDAGFKIVNHYTDNYFSFLQETLTFLPRSLTRLNFEFHKRIGNFISNSKREGLMKYGWMQYWEVEK